MRAAGRGFGVYVHVPWCRALCPYCDFAVAVPGRGGIPHEAYTDALVRELSERAHDFQGRALDTIYIGGGTPSLLRADCLGRIIERIRAELGVAGQGVRELTLEVNPVDCTADNLAAWRALGIDRLSIGAQSTDARTLAVLGRDHRQGDGLLAVDRARAAGFPRVSVDVIFGVPGCVAEGGAGAPGDASVRAFADAGVDHISAYELTVEARTRFGSLARRGRLPMVAEHTLADLYEAVHRDLEARGFEHYEISSYARPGQRSVHNQLYWQGGEYLGLGNGAASFRALPDGSGERLTNIRSAPAYMRSLAADIPDSAAGGRVAERVRLSAHEVAVERVWLGLRTRDGVAREDLAVAPGVEDWLVATGLAALDAASGRVRPTLAGFLMSNTVAARVVACADRAR